MDFEVCRGGQVDELWCLKNTGVIKFFISQWPILSDEFKKVSVGNMGEELISNKGVKTIQWGKNSFFSRNDAETTSYVHAIEFGPLPHIIHKLTQNKSKT